MDDKTHYVSKIWACVNVFLFTVLCKVDNTSSEYPIWSRSGKIPARRSYLFKKMTVCWFWNPWADEQICSKKLFVLPCQVLSFV